MTDIFEEAEALINGPRRESYGPVEVSFEETASIWSAILKRPVSPVQVALCMIGLKLQRESTAHSHDNLVDLAAYTSLASNLVNQLTEKQMEPNEFVSPSEQLPHNQLPYDYDDHDLDVPQYRMITTFNAQLTKMTYLVLGLTIGLLIGKFVF